MCNCDAGIGCKHRNSTHCSESNPYDCYNIAYSKAHLKPNQFVRECPAGLMFESAWPGGVGPGETPHLGVFDFELVDQLVVPHVPAGDLIPIVYVSKTARR